MINRIPAEVFPPGDFIKEELEARGWTQQDLAEILGKPLPTINLILNGKKAIVAETAQRLGAAFGNSAQFWMNLETAWQLFRQKESPETQKVRARAQIYDLAPVREMEKRGWLAKTKSCKELDSELRRFFSVESLDKVPTVAAAARASVRGEDAQMTAAQWAWCIRACHIAKFVEAKKFRRSDIEPAVSELRALAADPEEARHAPKVLAEIGIRLVVVEHLSKTRMDGAALWADKNTPIIAVSLRFGRLDHFWHTLLHELAHIFYRDGFQADAGILEQGTGQSSQKIEQRANQQAAGWLVDPRSMEKFIIRTTPLYSAQRVKNFAKRMGVHPSIVAGQLRYKDEIGYDKLTRLNVDVRDIVRNAAFCDGWGRVALDAQE